MIKVTVLYPYQQESRFDLDYYVKKHLELARSQLGDVLKGYMVESGITSSLLNDHQAAAFRVIGHLFFDTMADYQRAFLPILDLLIADTPAYTDITSLVQISEVVTYSLP